MEFASPSSSSNGTTASVATADGAVARVSNTPGIEDAVVNSTSTSSTDNSGDSSIDMLQDSAATHATHRKTFKIVFLGTGVSTAIPVMRHVLTNCCGVCKNAFEIPCSFNRRLAAQAKRGPHDDCVRAHVPGVIEFWGSCRSKFRLAWIARRSLVVSLKSGNMFM
jgi:hypothetical protein